MPQFNPGEERVAIATFPTKPAGLECTAELWLAVDSLLAATSGKIPFIATGGDKSISLPITLPSAEGTYPVYLYVFSNGQRIAAFLGDEDVVIIQPALILSVVNPRNAGPPGPFLINWGAMVYDLNTHEWLGVRCDYPCDNIFYPTSNTFLLVDCEYYGDGYAEYLDMRGPFLITLPELGEHIWDGKACSLDGIKYPYLPTTETTDSICKATGTVVKYTYHGEWGFELAEVALLTAEDIPGCVNPGKYFVGDTIARLNLGHLYDRPPVGSHIEMNLRMTRPVISGTAYHWVAQALQW